MHTSILSIQKRLSELDLDAYLVFTSDDHGSEYVVDHYKFRAFLSGFTGSAGTLVITREACLLWTDGRYFIQAARQLEGTGIRLMRAGEPGVPSINEFLRTLSPEPRIGMDFRIATVSFVEKLKADVPSVRIADVRDMADRFWPDRPGLVSPEPVRLSDRVTGESVASKLERVRAVMAEQDCPYALLTSLDDIAWLFNMRGSDIACNPVKYAFAVLGPSDCTLYLLSPSRDTLPFDPELRIRVRPYESVYADAEALSGRVLLDRSKTNYALYNTIREKVCLDVFPTTAFKAVKNATEIRRLRRAHVGDGVAVFRFIRFVKSRVGKEPMTELSLTSVIDGLRAQTKGFLDLSFETICGFGPHGAIVHYAATPETDVPVTKGQFLLVDSGGQYRTGTTDITRTIALGRVTKQMKKDFTLVLKAHIDLCKALFPKGTSGYDLDMLARAPLYSEMLNYRHGTGHGVGYILNVHEGPQRITNSARTVETAYPLKPGMLTSDEPGLYREGLYGIRHENLVLCVEKGASEYGTFYGLEPVTLVPFDLDAVLPGMLDESEKAWLNAYHEKVRRALLPHLTRPEQTALIRMTRPL